MKLCLLFVILCNFVVLQTVAVNEVALNHCVTVHNIENLSPGLRATFANSKCGLNCAIGYLNLPLDPINEGKPCPDDGTGICRNGQCMGGQSIRECSVKHNLDFHAMKDHQGTAFTNDQCMLRCVLGGIEISISPKYEGSPCPTNPNGVCRSGACVGESSEDKPIKLVSKSPIIQPTIQPTATVPKEKSNFSLSKVKLLNITLVSTNPPLKGNQRIELSIKASDLFKRFCTYNANPEKPNHCDYEGIEAFSAKPLDPNSQLSIDIWQYSTQLAAEKNAELSGLFEEFSAIRKMNFGEAEQFSRDFSLYSKEDGVTKDLVMHVQLRFTVVFEQ